jgi:hypothetical protein
LEVFRRLIVEKVEPDDSVMEWMTVRPIDTEDLRATGSFLEIGNVVFGKLLAQVEADHIEFGYVAHVPLVNPSGMVCSKSQEESFSPLTISSRRPSICHRPLQSHEAKQSFRHPSL